MNYTLLFYQSPEHFAARTDPQKREAFWASFLPYMKALQDAGVVVAGAGLEAPHAATTVRLRNGARLVQDGPYALVGRAAAVAEAYDAGRGWALLEGIPAGAVEGYQPYWALAAHLLGRLQRAEEAAAAYSRAISLCKDPATREFLAQQALRR